MLKTDQKKAGLDNKSPTANLKKGRQSGGGFFNRIKHCRRVATRYDRLAANYLAFIELASIRLWLSR
jgi:transposase